MRGQGHGKGHAGGASRERDDAIVPPQTGVPDHTEDSLIRHGRSEDSPGRRKQAAGAKSARDFAPGRARRA